VPNVDKVCACIQAQRSAKGDRWIS
jgi:hypothetical protein